MVTSHTHAGPHSEAVKSEKRDHEGEQVARTAALAGSNENGNAATMLSWCPRCFCPKLAGQLGVGWDRTLCGALIDPCPLAERGRIVVQDLGMGSPARKSQAGLGLRNRVKTSGRARHVGGNTRFRL
jgi:hypothetical protein